MNYFGMNYFGMVNLNPFDINNFGGSAFYPDLFALSPGANADQGTEPTDNPGYDRIPLREGVRSDVLVVRTFGGFQNTSKRVLVIPNIWVELKNKLMKDMKDFFGSNEAQTPSDLILGCNYAVFFKGIWNRVFLLHMSGASKAKIVFYDEGIARRMYVDRIKILPEQFFSPGPFVVEIKCHQNCPLLTKGDFVTFEFRLMEHPDIWFVEFVAGPMRMGNVMALMVEGWVTDAVATFSTDINSVTDKVTLSMAAKEYELPSPGVPFPVKVLRQTYKHIIAVPVAWLEELEDIISELPDISTTCRRLPYDLMVPGTSCAVPYAGGWFRARIRSADKATYIPVLKVRLIDTGFILHVDSNEARVLPPHLLPRYKKPLCFAIKKTAGMSEALPVGEFGFIKLQYKDKDDKSWIALPYEEPGRN